MGFALKVTYGKSGRRMDKMTDRRNWRLLTRSKRKVRGIKKTMEKEIMVISPLEIERLRKEQQQRIQFDRNIVTGQRLF